MCIMVNKDMRLSDVLEKIGSRKGEYLSPHLYVFRSFEEDTRKSQSATFHEASNKFTSTEMLRYKTMNNAHVFDMNTEVKNLLSFDLELAERPFGDFRMRRSTIKLSGKTPLGPYTEELKLPHKKDEKKEYEYLYNKFTASVYDEFDAAIVNPRGSKTSVRLGLDGAILYCYKKSKLSNPARIFNELPEKERKKALMFEIALKQVAQVEKAIFDPNKVYLWYMGKSNSKQRIDIEFLNESVATEVISKTKYVLGMTKHKQQVVNDVIGDNTEPKAKAILM